MSRATNCIVLLAIIAASGSCGGGDEVSTRGEAGDIRSTPEVAGAAPETAASEAAAEVAQPEQVQSQDGGVDGPQGGRLPEEGTREYDRPGSPTTIARSVVLCAAGVPKGRSSPLSPQWVSFSDKMAAELEERPEGCEIGRSDVVLQKVNMGEGDDDRARCGVGMRGTVASAIKWGYAGASATAVEGVMGEYQRLELMTRGDGKLYRMEFLMAEQLDLQCGDSALNPYGYEFRCGTGDDSTILSWDINLDGLQQQLSEGGKPWGKALPFDPDQVQRVQIRPVNAGGNNFGFDCKFRAHWFEPR